MHIGLRRECVRARRRREEALRVPEGGRRDDHGYAVLDEPGVVSEYGTEGP